MSPKICTAASARKARRNEKSTAHEHGHQHSHAPTRPSRGEG